MYVKVKIMRNMAMVFMLNDGKNPVAWYRSFLDTLYLSVFKQFRIVSCCAIFIILMTQ